MSLANMLEKQEYLCAPTRTTHNVKPTCHTLIKGGKMLTTTEISATHIKRKEKKNNLT